MIWSTETAQSQESATTPVAQDIILTKTALCLGNVKAVPPWITFGTCAVAPVIFVEHNNIPQSCASPSLWARIGSRGLATLMATAEDSFASHKTVDLHSKIEIPGANLAAHLLGPMIETPRGDLRIDLLDLKIEVPGPSLDVEAQRTQREIAWSDSVAEHLGAIIEVKRDPGVKEDHTWSRTSNTATWDDTRFLVGSEVLIRREAARTDLHLLSG